MKKAKKNVLKTQLAVMAALPEILKKVENGMFVKEAVEEMGLVYGDYWKYCPAVERERIRQSWRMFNIKKNRS